MRLPRTVRNVIISAFSLLVLFVVAALAYTLYMDQKNPVKPAKATTAPDLSQVTIKPPKPAANVRESAAIELLTSPVAPGANAMVSVKTLPDSTCTISVTYNKVASKDSGLVAKKADVYGTVQWSWTVDANAPIGTWPVSVTCAHNGLTAVVVGDLEVAKG